MRFFVETLGQVQMMRREMDRRSWLKKAGMATIGATLGARSSPAQVSAPYPELKYINLAGNENPYGPSPAVSMAIMKEVRNSCRYPFREEEILKSLLAKKEGVTSDCILLGNGCDEILSIAGDLYGYPQSNIVAASPTYLQLMHYAEKRGCKIKWVPHRKDMTHDLAGMEEAVDLDTSLVHICNPDTPSGTLLPPESIEGFCRRVGERSTVFLDEVYLDLLDDYESQTQIELVRQGAPVIIGRSFSKLHGLAGLRVGYAVARPDIIERLSARRMSSMNYLGVIAAIASVGDKSFHAQSTRLITKGRERFCSVLDDLSLPYTPSCANFVFHYTGIPVREFQTAMKKRNFLVGRPFPPYDKWCRISIGSESEMKAYESAMHEVFC